MSSYSTYAKLGQDKVTPKVTERLDVLEITSQQQRNDLISKYNVIIIDYFTTWCGPCKQSAPLFEGLAKKYEGRALFLKENVENNIPGIPVKIRGVPCFHFYINGKYIPELTQTGVDIEKMDKILESLFSEE